MLRGSDALEDAMDLENLFSMTGITLGVAAVVELLGRMIWLEGKIKIALGVILTMGMTLLLWQMGRLSVSAPPGSDPWIEIAMVVWIGIYIAAGAAYTHDGAGLKNAKRSKGGSLDRPNG